MDILAKTAEINAAAAYIRVMDIEAGETALLAAKLRFMRQRQTVDEAGFTGAVGAEDQSDGLERDALGIGKGFEVAYMQGGEAVIHRVSLSPSRNSRSFCSITCGQAA